ncbi:hypothetical protein FN846DRAFT_991064 [Sphaerosporella brunnea]|uniref:Uncharacterized protein n=1 Tax=Sphaerosporella brunnea TaxID=1250544 RepID=A0A5J5EQU7_9PEZI|nr:hypothetical protein FN846DRAFT_991064 [Sphaerosporella brunnea]
MSSSLKDPVSAVPVSQLKDPPAPALSIHLTAPANDPDNALIRAELARRTREARKTHKAVGNPGSGKKAPECDSASSQHEPMALVAVNTRHRFDDIPGAVDAVLAARRAQQPSRQGVEDDKQTGKAQLRPAPLKTPGEAAPMFSKEELRRVGEIANGRREAERKYTMKLVAHQQANSVLKAMALDAADNAPNGCLHPIDHLDWKSAQAEQQILHTDNLVLKLHLAKVLHGLVKRRAQVLKHQQCAAQKLGRKMLAKATEGLTIEELDAEIRRLENETRGSSFDAGSFSRGAGQAIGLRHVDTLSALQDVDDNAASDLNWVPVL